MTRTRTHKEPFKVGLTGGIASGKTTVSNLFAELGVPVIDTDVIARQVVEPGQPGIEEIRKRFGATAINTDGALDRRAMRKRIFADSEARADLEAILHPRIAAEVKRQSESRGGDYQLIVVPLLVDSELLQYVDRVLVVDCSEARQIERLLQRDSGSIDDAKRILASQSSRKERLAIADDVLQNDADIQHLKDQVSVLHERYQHLATL